MDQANVRLSALDFVHIQNETLLQKVAFLALLGFVFTVPWESVIDFGTLGSLARLAGFVAAPLGVLVVLEKRRTNPLPKFMMIAVIWFLYVVASYFWSIQPDYTVRAISTYAQLLIMVWLIIEQVQTPERFQALLLAAVLGCYFAMGVFAITAGPSAIRLALTGSVSKFQRSMLDTWVGANAPRFATGLALLVPAGRYLSLRLKNGIFRTLCVFYPLLFVPVLFISASRGALAAFAVGLLIYFFTAPVEDRGRLTRWGISILMSVIVAYFLVSNFVPIWSLDRLAQFGDQVSSGDFSNRGERWAATLDIFAEYPFLGIGPNTFGVVTNFTRNGDNTDTAHSVFFALLGESGLIGLGIYSIMVLSVLVPLFKLKGYERWLGLISLLTWATVAVALSEQYHKDTWLTFVVAAILPHIAAQIQQREKISAEESSKESAAMSAVSG